MTEQPLQAVEADALAEPEGVEVTLSTDDGDVTVLVPPIGRWYTEGQDALAEARYNLWAKYVLSDEDYAKWMSVRKRNDDMVEFMQAWRDATGEDPKGSRASRRSSRSTRKR